MMQNRNPLVKAQRALSLAAIVAVGALVSLDPSVQAQTQTTPSNLQLLDQALGKSAKTLDVAIDDMIFPRASFQAYRDRVAAQGDRSLSSAFYNAPRWTGGNVYYSFDAGLPSAQRTAFLDATKEWEKWAKLKFVARTNQANTIHVYQDASNGSFSYIGMVGGVQDLSLASWATKWTACHEIAHALGAMHEQCRSDRDTYVSINFANIQSGTESNFAVVADSINKDGYDFDSVMHYFNNAFAIDSSKPTIQCKPAYAQYQNTIGQRNHLSELDKAGMVAIYGAPVSNYSLAGAVTMGSAGVGGVSLSLGNGQTVQTNSAGSFSFPSVAAGTYTLTPSKTGYIFAPTSRKITLSANTTGANFSATVTPTYVSISSVTMVEGNAGAPYMTFNVSLSEPSTKTVTVNFATANGTALAGSDYTAKSGTLTFKAGATMAEVRINVLPDQVVEPNETFSVVLSTPVGASLKTYTGKGTLLNDDKASDAAVPSDAFDPSAPDG